MDNIHVDRKPQQVKEAKRIVPLKDASQQDQQQDSVSFRQVAESITRDNVCEKVPVSCPYPVLVGHGFLAQMKRFQSALAKANIHIVVHWWNGGESACRYRMPLEPHEEAALGVSDVASEEGGGWKLSINWVIL